jgi:hypothetical protein
MKMKKRFILFPALVERGGRSMVYETLKIHVNKSGHVVQVRGTLCAECGTRWVECGARCAGQAGA